MLTLVEIKERLAKQDEVAILELLQIDSEQLVDKFGDEIEEQYDRLCEEFQDEEDENQAT